MAQIKTKEQIDKITKACKITDALFTLIVKKVQKEKGDMTEIELRDFILSEIKKKGVKPSFPPIVTSGPRAGNEIHPQSTNELLSGFVILDFGVVYEKYMSDMTRMIYIAKKKNNPNQKEKNIYEKLLASQEAGIAMAKAGVKCSGIDAYTRKLLGKDAEYFIHMLGHGVGTRIHEEPKLYYKLDKPVLKEGMIITIEPGLYVKGKFGMRIEDTILITKKGPKVLTKSPKDLVILC